MALRVPKPVAPTLFKDGYKYLQGVDEAVLKNIEAARDLSSITRTSFGPNGRNKLLINHLERIFLTSDAATIIREIEVIHPAAKLLVMASQQQDIESGDATNLVLVFAGELLTKAEGLLKIGLSAVDVIQGYELAFKKLDAWLDEPSNSIITDTITNPATKSELRKAVAASVMSKQLGSEDLLTDLVMDASLMIMPKTPSNFNVDSVRVVKILGATMYDSKVVKGMVFGREPETTIKKATDAKVAVFTCPLDISQTETKGTVLIKSAKEMLDFSKGEENQIEKIIAEIAASGAKVLVTGGTIGELALHYINRYNMMAVKVLSKFDLRRLCRVVGASALTRLGAPLAEEFGHCSIVETVEIGSDRVTVFRQSDEEKSRTATIVLRGATQNILDDLDRAIQDGVNVVKAITKDGRLVAGGGASELEMAHLLTGYGQKTSGLYQHAIKKYAESLEVVPRTLAENSGLDATEILSKLYAAHNKGQSTIGVDILGMDEADDEHPHDGLADMKVAGVMDSVVIKKNALRLATEAALTILRIDQIIMSKMAGGPKPPKQNANWDED